MWNTVIPHYFLRWLFYHENLIPLQRYSPFTSSQESYICSVSSTGNSHLLSNMWLHPQRTKEVVDLSFLQVSNRVSSIRGARTKKAGQCQECLFRCQNKVSWSGILCHILLNCGFCCLSECGRMWMICEGFQFILKNQADALLTLGVHPRFKVRHCC